MTGKGPPVEGGFLQRVAHSLARLTARLQRLGTGEWGRAWPGYLQRARALRKLGLGGERRFHQLSGAEVRLSASWKLALPAGGKSVSTSSAAVPWLRRVSGSWRRHAPRHARLPCPRLPASEQTHAHWVSDAIRTSHPLLFSSPLLHLSQDQGLYQWADSLYQVPKVLELQHHSVLRTFKVDFL